MAHYRKNKREGFETESHGAVDGNWKLNAVTQLWRCIFVDMFRHSLVFRIQVPKDAPWLYVTEKYDLQIAFYLLLFENLRPQCLPGLEQMQGLMGWARERNYLINNYWIFGVCTCTSTETQLFWFLFWREINFIAIIQDLIYCTMIPSFYTVLRRPGLKLYMLAFVEN